MGIKARAQQNLTKVFDGSGVFSIILTNENTSIPISNQGLALNYTATPSDIYVYSGTSLLKPVASNPEPGEYTITASGENIIAGVISYNGNHASIGNASDFVTDKKTYSITFTASGKDFLGNPFTSQKKQVITALRHGDDATSYWVNTTASVVMKDVNDVLQPSSVTASAVSQEGFANATPYKGIFKVYIKTGVAFPTTPAYTSPAPEVSHSMNLDTTMNDIRIDMYSADGSNLLDTQTVPVIAQANGVVSTSIQYTVTDKNVQPTESASWADTIPTVGIGQFLWTKTTFYYTDGSNAVAYSMGHVGKDGASAPLLFLSSDSQAFTFDGADNPNPANQTINFVANLQNLTGTATFVATPYLDGAAGTPIALGGTGNARSLTVAQFGQVYDSVSVKASLGNLSDTETVYKLKDGANGQNGAQGVPGPKGTDGLTTYVHIAYANSSNGSSNFSTTEPTGRAYIGVYTDTAVPDSTDYTKYTWSLIKGADGSVGPTGATGAPGPKGSDGLTTYVHIAYANSANGATSFSTTDPTSRAYIGALTDTSVPDSTDYTKYTWSLVKGADGANGAQGVPGPKGTDGISTYIHFAYANSSNGSSNFSTTDSSNRAYIGVYTDTSVPDSTDYTKYTWSLIKGPQGQTGPQGIPGPVGPNGVSTYVHFAYANSSDGTVGFSTTANNQTYIGVYTDSTQTGATTPSRYTWSLMKGADGKNAITGWLTNESITLQADSNGNVPNYTSATGSFVVYNGTNQVTGLTVNQANAVGMTLHVSGMNYTVASMVADIAYVDLSVTYSGTTITKRLTLAKSKAGATGANGTSVVNSTTPPKNPTAGQWWNDMSVTPNVLKVYQSGNWIPYRIDAINLVAQSVTTDKLASDVLVASNVTYTNKNGTSTNLQTFNLDGIQTLLSDGNGHTYSSMDNAVSSTQSWTSLSKQVNNLGQVNQLLNTEFSPDFAGWNQRLTRGTITPVPSVKYNGSNVISFKTNKGQGVANTGSVWLVGQELPITAGQSISYSMSVYLNSIATDGTTTVVQLITRFTKSDGSISYGNHSNIVNTDLGKWKYLTVNNTIAPANTVSVTFYTWIRGEGAEAYISQPMLVFSQTVGDYVPGQYNNNDRVLKIEKSADDFQISIGQSVKDAQNSADTAKNKIDNLSVGGRNLLLGTPVSITGVGNNSNNGNFNKQGGLYYLVGGKKVSDLYNQYGSSGYLTISFDWVASGTTISGTFYPQWNNTPWQSIAQSGHINPSSTNTSGHYESSIALSTNGYSTSAATGIMFRQDNLQGNITISNLKLESGNKATDWTPAPEDQSAEITTQIHLAANSFKLGIDSNGNLISGISGNSKTLSLNGATIYLNSKTVIADNFVTRLLSTYDATISNKLTIGSGGSIQSTLDGSVWDFTGNPQYYANNGTTKAPWWQVQQQGTMAIDTSSTLHFDGSLTAKDVSIGGTPQYAYYTQTGRNTLGGTNKLNVSTSLGLNGLRIDQQDARNAAATGGYVFVTGHGLFTGYDQANPRFSVQSNGNVMADKLTFIGGFDYRQIVGTTAATSTIYQLNFNNGRNLYLDGGQYVRIASTHGINSGSKIYVTDTGIQLVGSGTLILRAGKNNNGYMYYETKKRGSGGSALYMASDGAIIAHSSATKYKSNIEYDTTTSLADRLMTVDLASWNDKNEERMRQEYKTVGNTPDYAIDKDGARYVGLIAEDLVKADLEEFVVRDVDTGSVESIRYDRIGIALIPAVRQQRDMINELRLEIERLKDKVQ